VPVIASFLRGDFLATTLCATAGFSLLGYGAILPDPVLDRLAAGWVTAA
jgi:hypothetical protein